MRYFFKKWAIPGRFSLFSSFQHTVDSKQMLNIQTNFCWWLDSNRRPLVLEATALPTEPQPLPNCMRYFCYRFVPTHCVHTITMFWLMFKRLWVQIPASNTGWTWHFFTLICCKIELFVWRDQNKEKEAGVGPFFKSQLPRLWRGAKDCVATSVTRFGKISPFWHYFIGLRRLCEGLLGVGQKFGPTLVNMLCHWANFHCCKWPNIDK